MNFYDHVKDKLTRYYDIYEDYEAYGNKYDFLAVYNQKSTKYFLSKKVEIFSIENDEYIFFKNLDVKDLEQELSNLYGYLSENAKNIISQSPDHMSSTITVIYSVKGTIANDHIKNIKNFKFYKSFMFGLRGWVNMKLIVRDSNGEIICNKLAVGDIKRLVS